MCRKKSFQSTELGDGDVVSAGGLQGKGLHKERFWADAGSVSQCHRGFPQWGPSLGKEQRIVGGRGGGLEGSRSLYRTTPRGLPRAHLVWGGNSAPYEEGFDQSRGQRM